MKSRGPRSKRRPATKARRPGSVPVAPAAIPEERDETVELAEEQIEVIEERLTHTETSPALSGGDVDADWARAESSGDEGVGGSVATPDQDIVDELGRALGVEQESEAEVHTSGEILRTRDRHYWHLERRAAEDEE